MEIEKDCSSESLRETIIINSDNFQILQDINLKTEQHLQVYVDMKNNSIGKYDQLYLENVMKALFKAEIIEMNVGMRFERKEETNQEEQGDWIHFIKGIGQSTKTLNIQIKDYTLSRLHLVQFGQELLRLNHLEKFHLKIGREKNLGVTGFTKLGEALRRMIHLQDLSIIIGDNCSLGVNGAKKLFYGMETCEKIQKLKVHIGLYNHLNAEGTQIISTAFGQLQRVSDFDLFIANYNAIGIQGMKSIAGNLLQQHLSKSAEHLSLKIDDMKAIKVESITEMFSSIERFTRLKNLSVDLGVKKEMNEDSIRIIQASLKKLTSLLKISISINSDPSALYITPMVDLLTRFQLSDKLVSLQLVIPPDNQFNNAALSQFAVNLKRLKQLQVFSLEIQENNLVGNTNKKRKEPGDIRNRKTNKKATKQQETIAQPRGINDISESLSNLKKLEKVEWIISTQNDVSDCGWEMLSRSQSLREFRVKIGERCNLQDEGLHSLSKISSSLSLDCLRVEVDNQNETSDGGWSNLLSNINFEKMKDFKICVGEFNECSQKSFRQLSGSLKRIYPRIEYLTLDFKESNHINSNSIQELADSLKSMVYLKQLAIRIPQDLVFTSSALYSLSRNLERMSELEDLELFFRIQDNVEMLDKMKLCQIICSFKHLHDFNLHVEGNKSFKGSSIKSKVKSSKSSKLAFWEPQNKQILEFKTENGLQFQMQLKRDYVSQKYIDKLAESLALFVLASQKIVYLQIQIDAMDVDQKCPQFIQLFSIISEFKKCITLKLNFKNHYFNENSLNQLSDSIVCMPFLSNFSLRLDSSVFPLKAAKTLAAFFENSPRITKVLLMCKSNPNIDQSQAQFLLMSSIMTCPNLRRFQVSLESYSDIFLQFKNQPKIEDLPLVSFMKIEGEVEKSAAVTDGEGQEIVEETNENVLLEQSYFSFNIQDKQEYDKDESLIHLGQFLFQTKLIKEIELLVSSAKQISTEIARTIQKGIMNQANLTDLKIEFFKECSVSGEGAVLLSQSFSNQKNKNRQTIKINTDDTFSIDYALTALVSTFKEQNLQMKREYLKITGTKFILATDSEDSEAPNFQQILSIESPKNIALYQRITLDQSEAISLSQITDKLSQLQGVKQLSINASEKLKIENQDWSLLRQLSFLSDVSILDKSLITSSRFLSLESTLSHMTHLKSLNLNLSHIHENLSSQQTIIIPFGKYLNNLKEVTEFKITFQDFNFGEDGGQALGYGIEGMTDLHFIEIECINPQNLKIERIKQWCEYFSKLPQIFEVKLNFSKLHSSLEIPFVSLFKKQLWGKQNAFDYYFISVNGKMNQAFGSRQRFYKETNHIKIYKGINHIYELKLPSKYCFKSFFKNEAIKKCSDILQVFNSFISETYSFENVNVFFTFTKPKDIEPNLIFLKTLFSILQKEQRRVKLLTIRIDLTKNGQFKFIFEKALKDLKLVDTFYLTVKYFSPYKGNIQELFSIASLDTLINLKILIIGHPENITQFRQRIMRKMKYLCHYELNQSYF